jgi:threonine dehydrogenase-like Zn-dependent dehydrogenase
LGADRGMRVVQDGQELPSGLADIIVDTTGSPGGLELALRLAGREFHLKSTHGQEAVGLFHLTEFVVDEMSIEGFDELRARHLAETWKEEGRGLLKIAWMSHADPPEFLCEQADVYRETRALAARKVYEESAAPGQLPRADVAVVDNLNQIDEALRPAEDDQLALVRPRGEFWIRPPVASKTGNSLEGPLVEAVSLRGLRVSSSRCGDFRQALKLLSADPVLAGISQVLITGRFPATQIQEAFSEARSPQCIKAIVRHPDTS